MVLGLAVRTRPKAASSFHVETALRVPALEREHQVEQLPDHVKWIETRSEKPVVSEGWGSFHVETGSAQQQTSSVGWASTSVSTWKLRCVRPEQHRSKKRRVFQIWD